VPQRHYYQLLEELAKVKELGVLYLGLQLLEHLLLGELEQE